jgi:hypothetical protein
MPTIAGGNFKYFAKRYVAENHIRLVDEQVGAVFSTFRVFFVLRDGLWTGFFIYLIDTLKLNWQFLCNCFFCKSDVA